MAALHIIKIGRDENDKIWFSEQCIACLISMLYTLIEPDIALNVTKSESGLDRDKKNLKINNNH